MKKILGAINLKKAAEDNRAELWMDPEKYSGVSDAQTVHDFQTQLWHSLTPVIDNYDDRIRT